MPALEYDQKSALDRLRSFVDYCGPNVQIDCTHPEGMALVAGNGAVIPMRLAGLSLEIGNWSDVALRLPEGETRFMMLSDTDEARAALEKEIERQGAGGGPVPVAEPLSEASLQYRRNIAAAAGEYLQTDSPDVRPMQAQGVGVRMMHGAQHGLTAKQALKL